MIQTGFLLGIELSPVSANTCVPMFIHGDVELHP